MACAFLKFYTYGGDMCAPRFAEVFEWISNSWNNLNVNNGDEKNIRERVKEKEEKEEEEKEEIVSRPLNKAHSISF